MHTRFWLKNPKGRDPLARLIRRSEDNIKMDLMKIG
jgi:hypothetical protein